MEKFMLKMTFDKIATKILFFGEQNLNNFIMQKTRMWKYLFRNKFLAVFGY
jgi:hypothetical protein